MPSEPDGSTERLDGRESWSGRKGFVLAAAGTAVGLGNFWRFPFQAGEEGGAAFVLIYILFILLVGIPLLLLEFSVGRWASSSPVAAFDSLASGVYSYLGWPMVAAAFLILSYYTVVSGWVLRYTVMAFSTGYPSDLAAAEQVFGEVATGTDALVFHAVFLGLTAAVVAFGVKKGIELVSLTLFPLSMALLGVLIVMAYRLPESGEAYAYYLRPDLGVVASEWQSILPSAAGQAFFTLTVGGGILLTYASYVDEDRSLLGDGVTVAGLDTVVAVAVGLVVFPVMFTAGVPPGEPGHSALFVTLSSSFGTLEGGETLGFVFFGTIALAALLTSVALLEVLVSHMMDGEGHLRRHVLGFAVVVLFLFGVPPSLDLRYLDVVDVFATEILLVSTMLAVTVYVAWSHGDEVLEEVFYDDQERSIEKIWLWLLRYPVPVILAVTLVAGFVGYGDMLRRMFGG